MVKTACIFLIFLIATGQYQLNVKRRKARRDIEKIWICISQHFIVLKLHSVLINKSIVPKFVIVKVSHDLKLTQKMSTQWNRKLNRYMSKVIDCLKQNKTFENKLIVKNYQILNKCSSLLGTFPCGFRESVFYYATVLFSHPLLGPYFILRKKH